jgi:ABC-type polysaccharide/polyol phosphate export permease
MKLIIKMLALFLLACFFIFAGVMMCVRGQFSSDITFLMFLFGAFSFFIMFVHYDLDKHSKPYEAAIKKNY